MSPKLRFNTGANLIIPPALDWQRALRRYAKPDTARGLIQLATDLIALLCVWTLGFLAAGKCPLVLLLTTPLAVGFLARLFAIFHDCGHNNYFRSRAANDIAGRILGVFLLVPYGLWRQTHQRHHATAGHLDHRGVGDIETLTIREYARLPRLQRLRYRLYRHPAVLLIIGPLYLFGFRYRVPTALPEPRHVMARSVLLNDIALAILLGGGAVVVGPKSFYLTIIPSLYGMGIAALWIFYVQHQFPSVQWAPHHRWKFADGALRGSAHYDLPALLRWFTGNIGIHHVHHLCPRIPSYRLARVLRDYPALVSVNRIGIQESLSCVRLALWDERSGRLVSFREAAAVARQNGAHPDATSLQGRDCPPGGEKEAARRSLAAPGRDRHP